MQASSPRATRWIHLSFNAAKQQANLEEMEPVLSCEGGIDCGHYTGAALGFHLPTKALIPFTGFSCETMGIEEMTNLFFPGDRHVKPHHFESCADKEMEINSFKADDFLPLLSPFAPVKHPMVGENSIFDRLQINGQSGENRYRAAMDFVKKKLPEHIHPKAFVQRKFALVS